MYKIKKIANSATKAISKNINMSKVKKTNTTIKRYEPKKIIDTVQKSHFYNQDYTAQMAKDISTYQYGKRMTGFVQG